MQDIFQTDDCFHAQFWGFFRFLMIGFTILSEGLHMVWGFLQVWWIFEHYQRLNLMLLETRIMKIYRNLQRFFMILAVLQKFIGDFSITFEGL